MVVYKMQVHWHLQPGVEAESPDQYLYKFARKRQQTGASGSDMFSQVTALAARVDESKTNVFSMRLDSERNCITAR